MSDTPQGYRVLLRGTRQFGWSIEKNPDQKLIRLDDGQEIWVDRSDVIDLQAFPTPPEVVQFMLHPTDPLRPGLRAVERREGCVLEPAANHGTILDALRAAGLTDLYAVDIDPLYTDSLRAQCGGHSFIGDYLEIARSWAQPGGPRFDLILTNPPFNLMQQFAEVSLPLLTPGGQLALFGRTQFEGSGERLALHRTTPHDSHFLPWRPSFTGGATDIWDYSWFIWTDGARGPGRKYYDTKPGHTWSGTRWVRATA